MQSDPQLFYNTKDPDRLFKPPAAFLSFINKVCVVIQVIRVECAGYYNSVTVLENRIAQKG